MTNPHDLRERYEQLSGQAAHLDQWLHRLGAAGLLDRDETPLNMLDPQMALIARYGPVTPSVAHYRFKAGTPVTELSHSIIDQAVTDNSAQDGKSVKGVAVSIDQSCRLSTQDRLDLYDLLAANLPDAQITLSHDMPSTGPATITATIYH